MSSFHYLSFVCANTFSSSVSLTLLVGMVLCVSYCNVPSLFKIWKYHVENMKDFYTSIVLLNERCKMTFTINDLWFEFSWADYVTFSIHFRNNHSQTDYLHVISNSSNSFQNSPSRTYYLHHVISINRLIIIGWHGLKYTLNGLLGWNFQVLL